MPPNSHTQSPNTTGANDCTSSVERNYHQHSNESNGEYNKSMPTGGPNKDLEHIGVKTKNSPVASPFTKTPSISDSSEIYKGNSCLNGEAGRNDVSAAGKMPGESKENPIVTSPIKEDEGLTLSARLLESHKRRASTEEVLRKANEILQKSQYSYGPTSQDAKTVENYQIQSIAGVGTSPNVNEKSDSFVLPADIMASDPSEGYHTPDIVEAAKNRVLERAKNRYIKVESKNNDSVTEQNSTTQAQPSTPNSDPQHLSEANKEDSDDVSVSSGSPPGSDIASPSYEGIPRKVCQTQNITRQKMLSKLDGLDSSHVRKGTASENSPSRQSETKTRVNSSPYASKIYGSMTLVNDDESVEAWSLFSVKPEKASIKSNWKKYHPKHDSNAGDPMESIRSIVPSPQAESDPSLRMSGEHDNHLEFVNSPSYDETNLSFECPDASMPSWFKQITTNNVSAPKEPNNFDPGSIDCLSFDYDDDGDDGGVYLQGKSRSLVVHEIRRGNWTWCTEWSPDGNRLAMATENHHLAIVDCSWSTVWKVVYDKRISGPMKNNTTHTIRSIAWGAEYIAIGGTGDSVSIINPNMEKYPIVEVIQGTGFVGSLSWRADTSILAIGNREDQLVIVDVQSEVDESRAGIALGGKKVKSKVLMTLERSDWVNAVSFSPGGSIMAIGDRSGKLSVYVYIALDSAPSLSAVTDFELEGAVLSVAWSPCGSWLYAGGEDYAVTIIDASHWKVVTKIRRQRWVTFVSPSNSGTHVAIGGGPSEVSVLDVENGWTIAKNFDYGGIIPLSASWHPKDHFLTITGQDNTISNVETTGLRYASGRFLRSRSCIVAIDFSPDGTTMCVGNEDGIVSFFDVSSSDDFVLVHETIVGVGGYMHIRWSPNGRLVAIASGETLVLINAMYDSKHMGPRSKTRFTIRRVLHGMNAAVESLSFVHDGSYLAISGNTTRILDVRDKLNCVVEMKFGVVHAMDCSEDGSLIALVGKEKHVTIVDTSHPSVHKWRIIFAIQCETVGTAVAWGPIAKGGLRYLAYGGENNKVTIIEIRTQEETWEKVLTVPRGGKINELDWNPNGLLSVAIGDGSTAIMDLAYLKSGKAVNEMSYNWQRQGLTTFAEIKRRQHEMHAVRWCIPFIPEKAEDGAELAKAKAIESGNLIALGGSDGIIEMIDMTERRNLHIETKLSNKQN